MTLKHLVQEWQVKASAEIANDSINLKLCVEDSAKIDALCEMYPMRSKEQILSELISAALAELESSFPYIEGTDVIATDEFGDPIYADVGPTPEYLSLSRKHFNKYKSELAANR